MMINIINNFVDRLADDIGIALSLGGEPSPLVDRFVNACLSDESGKWITIGGKPEGDKGKHVGGFRVQIDGDGKIIKGRLKGTNVKDVKKRFDEKKNRGTPIREKEEESRTPHFMKNQKSEDFVKNTVDNSRNDANIEGTAAKETAGNDDAKGIKMDREGQIEALKKSGFSVQTSNSNPNISWVQGKYFDRIPTVEEAEKEVGELRDKENRETEEYTKDKVAYLSNKDAFELTEDRKAERASLTMARAKELLPDFIRSLQKDSNRGNVFIKLDDPKTGNTVLKSIELKMTDAEIKAIVPAAKKEMKKRQTETRSAMRAERESNNS